MNEHDPLHQWLAGRRGVEPPAGFSDRVMAGLHEEATPSRTPRRRLRNTTWLHVAACVAASIIFALRLGCVYSVFIPK